MVNNFDLQKTLEKEIDIIQSCITRMSQHSFYLKGWLISLITITLTVMCKSNNILFIDVVLILVSLVFWYLNATFLRFERMYRELYKWVIRERINGNEELLYDLNLHRFEDKVDKIGKTMFSSTLRPFYLVIIIPLLLLMAYCLYPVIS